MLIKAQAAGLLKKYPDIRKYLWKKYFWSRSYCLITTGGVSINTIKQYIQAQGGGEAYE